MGKKGFYYEFERHFRGSRAEIAERLHVYRPFLELLKEGHFSSTAIDLGCGRGEWLELLASLGFEGHGVDLDDSMIETCRDLGLAAENADAIDHLERLPDESQSVVSGFHIAEHLPFDRLRALIGQAFRVLEPGGLLILETPNAENIVVGTLTFHLDPTHVKPLPPGLLSFLPRYHGFFRSTVLRLQESAQLVQQQQVGLMDVFGGASPDYAVIAQKPGPEDIVDRFNAAFEADRGLTLKMLSDRFDQKIVPEDMIHARFEELDQVQDELAAARQDDRVLGERLDIHDANLDAFRGAMENLGDELSEFRTQMALLRDNNTEYRSRSDVLEGKMAELHFELAAIHHSWSWRMTRPLRAANAFRTRLAGKAASAPRQSLHRFIRVPAVRAVARVMAGRFPRFAAKVRHYLVGHVHHAQAVADAALTDGRGRLQAAHLSTKGRLFLDRMDNFKQQ